MKLWEKDVPHDEEAVDFSSSKDRSLDLRLLPYDCKASLSHAKGLHKIGLLDDEELGLLVGALEELKSLINKGHFAITDQDEDCHSAIERYLIEELGELGKKIHTCRSRNDQVLCALRLYSIDELEEVSHKAIDLLSSLYGVKKNYGKIRFAGHTHTRKAMPTTVNAWVKGYMASIKDSIALLDFIAKFLKSNPLGTGAGYGLPIATDRKYVASELDFKSIDVNGIYSQLSRTKHEKLILSSLSSIMYDLNRLSNDIILFSYPDLGYFNISKELTTGSSIMPQKANPDVLEVIRGYYSAIIGYEMQTATLAHNLISGYHRDMQISKEGIFNSFDITISSLTMMNKVLTSLEVSKEKCEASLTPEVYLTEKAYDLVKEGVPFRTAYRKVADEFFREDK